MKNPKTFNEFLLSLPASDSMHSHMLDLMRMEMRLQDELTHENVRAYLGMVTAARSYCEDSRYNMIEVVNRYFKSLTDQCRMMQSVLKSNKHL